MRSTSTPTLFTALRRSPPLSAALYRSLPRPPPIGETGPRTGGGDGGGAGAGAGAGGGVKADGLAGKRVSPAFADGPFYRSNDEGWAKNENIPRLMSVLNFICLLRYETCG
jgi:hypothetical protein